MNEKIREAFEDMHWGTHDLTRDPSDKDYYLYDDVQDRFNGFKTGYKSRDKELQSLTEENQKLRDQVELECEWKEDSEYCYYETSCGEAFTFIEGNVKDNNHKYCPYCGKRIKDSK